MVATYQVPGLAGRRATMLSVGDSITAHLYDTFQAVGSANSYGSYSSKGIQFWANVILGSPLTLVGNEGYTGYSSGQLLPLLPTWLAYRADIACVLMGENDQFGGTNSTILAPGDTVTPGTSIYNIFTICEAFRAAGSLVVLGTVMPSIYTYSAANNAHRNSVDAINRWIRSYAQSTPGVLLVDYARVFANPNPADTSALTPGGSTIGAGGGGPLTNVTEDGLHPSNNGAMVLGIELARVLAPYVGPLDVAAACAVDYFNYATNPLCNGNNASGANGFLNADAAVTGNGPDGWVTHKIATGTGAVSKVARPDTRYADSFFQVASTATADWDGTNITTGSDDVSVTGRYDQTWAATTAYTIGFRRKPTVANGYIYKCTVGGTSGGSEPTWPTTEGYMVNDGTCVWLCQKMPAAGDQFYGIAEIQVPSLTSGKWGQINMVMYAMDNTGAIMGRVYGPIGYQNGSFPAMYYWPSGSLIFRTPIMTLSGANPIRYLVLQFNLRAQAGGTITVNIARPGIIRVS